MKIHPMGAEPFHADRQTSMTKLIVAFHNSVNAPKNVMPTNIYILVTDTKLRTVSMLQFCTYDLNKLILIHMMSRSFKFNT
jgi:hypothetical protein